MKYEVANTEDPQLGGHGFDGSQMKILSKMFKNSNWVSRSKTFNELTFTE